MRLFLSILFACTGSCFADLRTDMGLTGGERIAITGDSITDAHKYSHYVASWFYLMYPDLDLKVYSQGRGGSSIQQWDSFNYEQRGVSGLTPDFVTIMHGHNGGNDAIEHHDYMLAFITNKVENLSGASPVILGVHPLFQADGKPIYGQFDDQNQSIAEAADPDYLYVRTWHSMTNAWLSWFGGSPATNLWTGADNGHPGIEGHICIAYTVLAGLGAETNVADVVLSASGNSVTSSNKCSITNLSLTSSGGTFDRLDESLPWAIDVEGRATAWLVMPEIQSWQHYGLTVTGLDSGDYRIKIGGEHVATYTHADLAVGVNLVDLTDGPIYDQVQSVLDEIRDLQGVDRDTLENKFPNDGYLDFRGAAFVSYDGGNGNTGQALIDDLADDLVTLDAFVADINAAAEPVSRTWQLERIQTPAQVRFNLQHARTLLIQ